MKMRKFTLIISLGIIIIIFGTVSGFATRVPTFGVNAGETYVYKLETARMRGSATNANYTIYGDWVGDNLVRTVATEGDMWNYTILSTTVGQYDWYGINVTLAFGNLTVSGDIFFWLLHDLMPWELSGGFGLYNSLFQDIHSDNDTYWESEVSAFKEVINMSYFNVYDVSKSGNTLKAHIVPKEKSWEEEQWFEVDLAKGIITSMEVKLNSSLDFITADHIKIVCVTVPPTGGNSSPGFEGLFTIFSGSLLAIPIMLKRKR